MVPVVEELPFERSTMYSFPAEVKITSLREFTELEPFNRSPKKTEKKTAYKSYDKNLMSGIVLIFIKNLLYIMY